MNTGKGTPGAVTEKVVIGADENIQLIPGTGLLFQETGKEVEITQVMPHMKEQLGDVDIREGDVLRRVNDTDIESYAQLSSTYEKIEVGAEVSFVLQRGEKEITVLFTKPKVQGKITIK